MKKTNPLKRKWRRSILIGCIAAVTLPITAYASLQPIDLDIDPETVIYGNDSSQPWDESLPSGDETPAGWEDVLQIPPIINTSKDIYHSISSGNVNEVLNGVIGILGELGLLNPTDAADNVGVGSESPAGRGSGEPYANPKTPAEVYDMQRSVGTVRSEIPQNFSQVVFSPQGQQVLSQQAKAIQQAQQASGAAQQGVAQASQASAQQAQQNAAHAENVKAKAVQAKSATASQDVLKAIAAQNEDLASIGSGNSAQLSELARAASYQSTQLNAANTQMAALNDKTQTLEVLSASQNDQMAQSVAAIDHQNHYQHLKDAIATNAAVQASSMIFIPGLTAKRGMQ